MDSSITMDFVYSVQISISAVQAKHHSNPSARILAKMLGVNSSHHILMTAVEQGKYS